MKWRIFSSHRRELRRRETTGTGGPAGFISVRMGGEAYTELGCTGDVLEISDLGGGTQQSMEVTRGVGLVISGCPYVLVWGPQE